MTFSERMKELLDQGAQASKDLLSKAGEKAQDLGEKSRILVNKAGEKAQDFGEKSVLRIEIKQLESQAQKQMKLLGMEVYMALVEREEKTLDADTPELRPILAEIAAIKENIENKEAQLNEKIKK